MRTSNDEMRVLHVINSLGLGGAERLVSNLVSELNERDQSVQYAVCTLFEDGVWAEDLRRSGVRVHSLRTNRWNFFGVLYRLYLLIRKGGYNIVHAHLWPTLYYVGILSALYRTPEYIFTEHNTWNRRRGWVLLRWIESRIYLAYDRVVANSPETRQTLLQWVPQLKARIKIIENGVTVPESKKQSWEWLDPIPLLVVGRLVRQKGVDLAIDAVERLNARGRDVRLTVVGDGPEKSSLQRQASGLPVVFTGYHPEPQKLMANHTILLMPSRWEGFGMTAIEAAFVGVPVVASRIDALRRIICHRETGLLFSPENTDDLVAKIEMLIADPSLARRVADGNRKRAWQEWTMKRFAEDTMEFYHPYRRGASPEVVANRGSIRE